MKPRAGQIKVNPTGLDNITSTNLQTALAQMDAAVTAGGGGGGGSVAPDLVQYATASAASTSLAFTVSTPSAGSLLTAILSISDYGGNRTVTPPSGWTQQASINDATSGGNDELTVYTRVADGSEGTTITFLVSGGSEHHSGVLIEWDSGDFVDIATTTASGYASPSITDTPGHNRGVAAWICGGNNISAQAVATSGWTTVAGANHSGFHSVVVGYRNAETTAAETGITATLATGQTPSASMTMLIGAP